MTIYGFWWGGGVEMLSACQLSSFLLPPSVLATFRALFPTIHSPFRTVSAMLGNALK